MTKEEFEIIIKPIALLNFNDREFLKTVLIGNFNKWREKHHDKDVEILNQNDSNLN